MGSKWEAACSYPGYADRRSSRALDMFRLTCGAIGVEWWAQNSSWPRPYSASSRSLVFRNRRRAGRHFGLIGDPPGSTVCRGWMGDCMQHQEAFCPWAWLIPACFLYLQWHVLSSPTAPGVQQQSSYWQCTVMVWFEALNDCAYSSKISLLDPCLGTVARQSRWSPRPPTTSRPGTAQSSAHAGRSSSVCLLYGGCPLPDATVSDELFTEDDPSDLIDGNICFLILFFLTPPPPSDYYCWWKPEYVEYHLPMVLLIRFSTCFLPWDSLALAWDFLYFLLQKEVHVIWASPSSAPHPHLLCAAVLL